MSLPASQQHTLDAIDNGLQYGDPRLARMFAVFTRLTRLESMPARETLPPRQRWPRGRWAAGQRGSQRSLAGRLLVPVLLAAALSLLIMSILANPSAGRRGCPAAHSASAAFRLMSPAVCPPAGPAGAAQVAK
jgi:hypothetical protein